MCEWEPQNGTSETSRNAAEMVASPYVSGDHRFDFLSETIDKIGHCDQLADKERHLMKISS